jgi:hypothetical protein
MGMYCPTSFELPVISIGGKREYKGNERGRKERDASKGRAAIAQSV